MEILREYAARLTTGCTKSRADVLRIWSSFRKRVARFFLPCSCGERRRVCSWTVVRFKPRCGECGHSAACHQVSRWRPAFIIVLMFTASMVAWTSWPENTSQSATATAGLPAAKARDRKSPSMADVNVPSARPAVREGSAANDPTSVSAPHQELVAPDSQAKPRSKAGRRRTRRVSSSKTRSSRRTTGKREHRDYAPPQVG